MTDDRWALVDRYITGRLLPPDRALESALAASDAAGLRAINISPAQGKLLFLLAKSMGARRVLELGTLGGYSAIWLARALPSGGRLVTIEVDDHAAAVARANFVYAGCGDIVDLRIGSALDVLPRLEAEASGPFDFVFIDADKVSYPEYLKWSVRLGRIGTLIVADNVVRKGSVGEGLRWICGGSGYGMTRGSGIGNLNLKSRT